MSDNQNNNNSPDLDSVKANIEKSLNFADWLIDLWESSKWSKRLILLNILIITAVAIAKFYLNKDFISSDITRPFFYSAISLSFIIAVVIAFFERKKTLIPRPDIPERNAIKGLRAFDFNDAEIFKRLQRNDKLASCLTVITSSDFKFGVLYAESGCGKTSFLQAGLHHLLNNNLTHSCVYVKFSNEEPIANVSAALQKTANQATEKIVDLVNNILIQQNKTHLVLVLDQFEQLFLHHPQPAQRDQFLQAFIAWHQHKPLKILISIRSDYTYALREIEEAVKYTPNWQEKFELKKFTPQQSIEIFRVLAELNQLPFDENFVAEICRTELAKDAGLISPVDIQILAWLVAGFQQEESISMPKGHGFALTPYKGALGTFINAIT